MRENKIEPVTPQLASGGKRVEAAVDAEKPVEKGADKSTDKPTDERPAKAAGKKPHA